MTKTQKQFDKLLRTHLTHACERIKDEIADFSWLTHSVNLNKPSNPLKVSCYFKDELALEYARQKQQLVLIETIVNNELSNINLTAQTILFLTD